MSSSFDVGRSSFAPLSGATARQVSACHAEAFGVGGLHLCFVFSKLGTIERVRERLHEFRSQEAQRRS